MAEEDLVVAAHSEKVQAEQEKRAFPLQSLRGGKKPSDVLEVAKWEAPSPGFESWVDVYEGPSGVGYVVSYEMDKGGTLFRKALNFGPERHREQDWQEVAEDQLGK